MSVLFKPRFVIVLFVLLILAANAGNIKGLALKMFEGLNEPKQEQTQPEPFFGDGIDTYRK